MKITILCGVWYLLSIVIVSIFVFYYPSSLIFIICVVFVPISISLYHAG